MKLEYIKKVKCVYTQLIYDSVYASIIMSILDGDMTFHLVNNATFDEVEIVGLDNHDLKDVMKSLELYELEQMEDEAYGR